MFFLVFLYDRIEVSVLFVSFNCSMEVVPLGQERYSRAMNSVNDDDGDDDMCELMRGEGFYQWQL